MFEPIYADHHRATVLAAYAATGSCREAALAAGVGPTWAYLVLRNAGAIQQTRRQPTYSAAVMRRARELYETPLSCRLVAAQLAVEFPGKAPPAKRVEQYLRRLGLTRSRRESLLLRHRTDGRRSEAERLLAEGVPPKEVCRRLRVSRNWLTRWFGPGRRDEALDGAVRGSYWLRNPARRALRVRAGELRLSGMAGPAIARGLGVPMTTVFHWLRQDLPGLSRRRNSRERTAAA